MVRRRPRRQRAENLFYLPEAHTDFVFAVIAEEFGLVGSLVVILLFGTLIWRVFGIARESAMVAGRLYQANLAFGFAIWQATQVFINIGVNMGILPTKGLTAAADQLRSQQPIRHADRPRSSATDRLREPPDRRGRCRQATRSPQDDHAQEPHVQGEGAMTAPILIMAGGTGGHVFPALAVARVRCEVAIRKSSGSARAAVSKSSSSRSEGIALEVTRVAGLRGKGLVSWIFAPAKLLLAIFDAIAVLRRRRPKVGARHGRIRLRTRRRGRLAVAQAIDHS